MKRGLETILLSSFVLIFLVTFFPWLASADLYVCINQQTNQAKIVQFPSQCLKPSILHTFTNADIARLKTTTPSIVQPEITTKSSRRVAAVITTDNPACKHGYKCYWIPITKTCGYYSCFCNDGSVNWVTDVDGTCNPTGGGTPSGTKPRSGVPLK